MLELCRENLRTVLASAVFRNPLLPIRNREQQLDEFSAVLADSMKKILAEGRLKVTACYEQVVRIEPHRLLGKKTIDLNNLWNRASAAIRTIINNCQMQLTAQENRLIGLNPKSVLNRGYTITTNKKTGQVIRKPEQIEIGDSMVTELAKRKIIESKVTKK